MIYRDIDLTDKADKHDKKAIFGLRLDAKSQEAGLKTARPVICSAASDSDASSHALVTSGELCLTEGL